jgi:hypothetical protein
MLSKNEGPISGPVRAASGREHETTGGISMLFNGISSLLPFCACIPRKPQIVAAIPDGTVEIIRSGLGSLRQADPEGVADRGSILASDTSKATRQILLDLSRGHD